MLAAISIFEVDPEIGRGGALRKSNQHDCKWNLSPAASSQMLPGGVTTVGCDPKIAVTPGRVIKTTEVFDTYWRLVVLRQGLFMRRVAGNLPPWIDYPVLASVLSRKCGE